jgi:hypothetical protein
MSDISLFFPSLFGHNRKSVNYYLIKKRIEATSHDYTAECTYSTLVITACALILDDSHVFLFFSMQTQTILRSTHNIETVGLLKKTL